MAVRRDFRRSTLRTTSLVNEAWLKLAASPRLSFESRLHFNRIVGRAMRQVLVDGTRRRNAVKRGRDVTFVGLGSAARESAADVTAVTLRRALADLARQHPRQAQIVRCRFFSGLQLVQIAVLLGVSEATILRDWRAAREWLATVLTTSVPPHSSTRPRVPSPPSTHPRI
jgi:RNA polymerase sigma factor (TIGR02999 family)